MGVESINSREAQADHVIDFSDVPDREDLGPRMPAVRVDFYENQGEEVHEAATELVDEYAERYGMKPNELLTFLLAISHTESTHRPSLVNPRNNGLGITQLTGVQYSAEDVSRLGDRYKWNMGLNGSQKLAVFGGDWISAEEVSVLEDPHDVEQNLQRFLTGFAGPAYRALVKQNPEMSSEDIWRRIAFHWHHGVFEYFNEERLSPDSQEPYLTRVDGFDQWWSVYGIDLMA